MSHPTVTGFNVPANDQVNNQNQNTNTISKGRFSVSPNTSKNVKLVVLGIVASIAILAVLASIGVSIAHTQTNVPFASNLLNGMGNLSLIPQIAIPVVGSLIAGGAIYGMKKVKQNHFMSKLDIISLLNSSKSVPYYVDAPLHNNNNNNQHNSSIISSSMPGPGSILNNNNRYILDEADEALDENVIRFHDGHLIRIHQGDEV